MSLLAKYSLTIFLLLSAISGILSGYYYQQLRDEIIENRIKIVGTVADARHNELKLTLSVLKKQLHSFLVRYESLCRSERTGTSGECNQRVGSFGETEKLESLTILQNGKIIATHGAPLPEAVKERIFADPGHLGYFHAISGESKPRFYVVASLPQPNMVVIAAYPLRLVEEIFANRKGLGESGETFLANASGMFITPARYHSTQGVSHPISAVPMQRCLNREETEILEQDYRDVPIIHGFRFVPEIGGGCTMAHIDQQEAFAPLEQLKFNTLIVLASFIFLSLIFSMLAARRITAPIRQLCVMAGRIADGEFDQLPSLPGKDEMAYLSETLRDMAGKLLAHRLELEQKVLDRTSELQVANNELFQQIQQREQAETQLREAHTFQQAILNSANFTIIATDPQGIITAFNSAAEEKLGYHAHEVVGRVTPAIIHDPEEVMQRAELLSRELGRPIAPGFEVFVAHARAGNVDENEWSYIRKDGTRFPVALSVTPVLDDQGCLTGFLGVGMDITQRKQAEARLLLAYKVIESVSEAILITTPQAVITYVNPAYEQLSGWSREEVLGKNPSFAKSGRHGRAFYEQMWRMLVEYGHWEGELWDRHKSGEIFPKWLSISAIKDNAGQVLQYVGLFKDISQQKAIEQKLQNLAYYDPLTGLANRALFRDRLTHEIAAAHRNNRGLAVFFLDLDRFKQVNDTLGHAAGDELLQIVSQRIAEKVRESDTVARLGGDEFTVVLTDVSRAEEVSPVAQGIIDTICAPMTIKEQQIHVGASVGVAIYPGDGLDFDTLTKHADMAMYLAKEKGRNNYQFFSEKLQRRIFDRIRLEDELGKAIELQQLQLYYQPKFDLDGDRLVGMESLIRWFKPDEGMVSPVKFIPLAEETGLILPMGDWILETACRQSVGWNGGGDCRLQVAVNLSARQFQQPDLVRRVRGTLECTQLEPSCLELEITESMVMGNVEEAIAIMKRLRELGINLAMDDFGTGYSSLNYLKRFPVNTLKIDQSFVRELSEESSDAAIVRAIIGLAHSLNLKVVAEGVETASQMTFLRQHDCDLVQGYFLSKPLPQEEFAKFIGVYSGSILTKKP